MSDVRTLLKKRPLLFDGGMGTYYKGAPGRECEQANRLDPEGIQAVHRAYLAAGADAIKTNTFGLPRMAAAQDPEWEALADAGWKLAAEAAAGTDAAVFADLGPAPDTEGLSAAQVYTAVVRRFAALGAKNYLFETLSSDTGVLDAVRALRETVPDAFVQVSFAVLPDGYTREGQHCRALVRRMAGVTDRKYLFEISDAIAARDAVKALQEIAALRQQSVDMRRLCMELAGHYRNLMLCALPGGTSLLTGISPEEEAAYTQRRDFPQREAIRAVNAFGSALEKMSRGTDQRIELELAIFSLTQPETAAAPVIIQQPSPAAPAAPQAFASAPRAYTAAPPVQAAPSVVPPVVQPQSVPAAAPDDVPPPIDDDPPFLQPELKPAPQQAPAPVPPAPAAPAPRKAEPPRQAGPLEPFAFWPAVLADLEENDAMLISFLRGTRAYCDGKRVLFECSDAFRDYIRNNREVSKRLKETIYRVSRTKYSIGPYEEPKTDDTTAAVSLDETLHTMQALGVDLKIVDK